eukprot:440921_1
MLQSPELLFHLSIDDHPREEGSSDAHLYTPPPPLCLQHDHEQSCACSLDVFRRPVLTKTLSSSLPVQIGSHEVPITSCKLTARTHIIEEGLDSGVYDHASTPTQTPHQPTPRRASDLPHLQRNTVASSRVHRSPIPEQCSPNPAFLSPSYPMMSPSVEHVRTHSQPLVEAEIDALIASAEPIMSVFSGKVKLSDFDLLFLIGVGTFGKVYLVEKHNSGMQYAMKVIRKKKVIERRTIDSAHAERNVLVAVTHPFIVDLNYAFQTPSKLYLIMDYIPGGDLFGRIPVSGDRDVRFYVAEMVLAIEHLHSHDILYRDLKPENVLINWDGHICLSDFGLAKIIAQEDNRTKSFCGTLHYMAPEIITGSGYGKAADWWALGCMVHELFVGDSPFTGKNKKKVTQAILNKKLQLPKWMSAGMRSLVRGLLNHDPKKRFSAKDVKKHRFFKGMDWEAVLNKQLEPPFKPKLTSAADVSFFDGEFTSLSTSHSTGTDISQSAQHLFDGFSYTGSALETVTEDEKRNETEVAETDS